MVDREQFLAKELLEDLLYLQALLKSKGSLPTAEEIDQDYNQILAAQSF